MDLAPTHTAGTRDQSVLLPGRALRRDKPTEDERLTDEADSLHISCKAPAAQRPLRYAPCTVAG